MRPFTNQEASIYIFALRYALPRKTGAIDFVCHEIIKNLERFSEHDKAQMKAEIALDGRDTEIERTLLKLL